MEFLKTLTETPILGKKGILRRLTSSVARAVRAGSQD
ncbi:uncharacterized protein G2W53_031084 [Senna tora]|uniref:Uncharacterized protein n=1 Tax=Senna tora TaxID=362788 RepID=A0A834WBE3_9FABA|nr:uncharacterized protein G2W53_031084 [Senna tora]